MIQGVQVQNKYSYKLCAIYLMKRFREDDTQLASCLPMFMRSIKTRRPEAIALLVISISNTPAGSRRRLNPESMKITFNVCTQGTHTRWILVLQQTT
jgi:hypothetical protein